MRISYRHIKRYKEIAQVMVKYGFSFIIERINKEGSGSKIDVSSSEPKDDIKNMTSGQRLRLALQELGPTYIKMGQILSTRRDLLDQDMIDELVKLRDDVETFDTDVAMAIIEEETGRNIEEIFSEFDKEPIAAASIGQVYNAVLKDGEKVVIKVQRPDIEETIKSDLEILKRVSGSIQDIIKDYNIDMKEMLEELSSQLLRELDYNFEAVNAVKMKRIFQNSDEVYIPEIHMEYTTKRVLIMERIEGIKLSDIDLIREKGWDTKKIAHIGVKAFLRQVFDFGFFHADQHPGNIFVLSESQIAYIDFGMIGMVDNHIGVKAFLRQVFDFGFFHADQHPGNIFVLSESQIAYIDFGMIGMVDNRTLNFLNKFALAASFGMIGMVDNRTLNFLNKFALAASEKNVDKIVRVLTEIDAIGEETDIEGFKGEMLYMIHYYYDIPLERISIGTVLNEIFRFFRKYKITMPPQLITLAKTIITLEGTARTLDPEFSAREISRAFIKNYYKSKINPKNIVMETRGNIEDILLEGTARTLDPEFSAREISRAFIKNYYKSKINPKNIVMETRGNIEDILLDLKNLPKQIKNVLRIVEKNNVKISVEEVKMTRIEDCIKELTTQMTMALVLASIIVGSSLIIASPNIERNMGIKYMAIAGFFVSFIIGTTQMTMALVLASIIVGSSLIIASPNIERNMGIKYMAIAGFFVSFIIGLILVIEIVKVKLKKR